MYGQFLPGDNYYRLVILVKCIVETSSSMWKTHFIHVTLFDIYFRQWIWNVVNFETIMDNGRP